MSFILRAKMFVYMIGDLLSNTLATPSDFQENKYVPVLVYFYVLK